MVDINATIPLLEPVSYTFREVLGYIEFFVGGIFGIYLGVRGRLDAFLRAQLP